MKKPLGPRTGNHALGRGLRASAAIAALVALYGFFHRDYVPEEMLEETIAMSPLEGRTRPGDRGRTRHRPGHRPRPGPGRRRRGRQLQPEPDSRRRRSPGRSRPSAAAPWPSRPTSPGRPTSIACSTASKPSSARSTILVNNAGIEPRADVCDFDEATYDAVMDTNLKGRLLLCPAGAAENARGRLGPSDQRLVAPRTDAHRVLAPCTA